MYPLYTILVGVHNCHFFILLYFCLALVSNCPSRVNINRRSVKLIKKVSLDDVMLIKTISKRDINSVCMGKLVSAVFEEESEHATGKRFCKKQCIKI